MVVRKYWLLTPILVLFLSGCVPSVHRTGSPPGFAAYSSVPLEEDSTSSKVHYIRLRGQLVDEFGRAVAGVVVQAETERSLDTSARTDREGHFSVQVVVAEQEPVKFVFTGPGLNGTPRPVLYRAQEKGRPPIGFWVDQRGVVRLANNGL